MDTTSVETLSIEITTNANTAADGIYRLKNSLKKLKDVCAGGIGLSQVSVELSTLAEVMSQAVNKLAETTSVLKDFKSSTKGLGTSFEKASDSVKKFTEDTDKSKDSIKEFQNAVQTLRSALTSIKEVFNGFINKIKRAGRFLSDIITESNSYIENLNLFRTGMGQYADEAEAYAERVSEAMGLDPGQFMRYQGVFNAIIKGFGVAGDKAAFMSQNLTTLGYDLASLYNQDFEDSMEKLQSAISGQVKGVRAYGYDILDTTLQQIAYAHGIDKSTDAMTQAEKVQLRYIALMEQVTFTQDDMARTINAPANQLRILNQQLTLLKRELGNVIIPLLTKVLPYIIAFIKVLRKLAEEVALAMGFELPEIDYSSITETGEAFDEATESAKKFKNLISGFDELNIMSGEKDNGMSVFDIDLPGYDFLADFIGSKIDEITAKLEENLDKIKAIIAGLIVVAVLFTGLSGVINTLSIFSDISKMFALFLEHPEILGALTTVLEITAGIALLVAGIYSAWKTVKEFIDKGITQETLPLLFNTLMLIFAALALFTGQWYFLVAAVIAGIISIIIQNWDWIKEHVVDPVWDFLNTDVNQVIYDHVIVPIKNGFATLFEYIGNIWDVFLDKAKGVINSVLGFFENTINSIIKAFNSISIDLPDWLPLIGGKTFGINLSLVSIPRLANGGVVDKGQMFIAREAGAEMVGAIGSKTGVANNEQIVEGITDGVRMANADVLRAIQTLIEAVQDTSITIGDETIARSAARGNNSYRKMTGRPLIV